MSLATAEVSSDLDSDSEEQADEDKVSIDDTNDDADDEEQVDGQTFLQEGVAVGFFIVKIFHTPDQGFNLTSFNDVQIERLGLTAQNITLPAAIMLMDPEAYPTFSKARKESRKGAMLIHRRPISMSKDNNNLFDVENSIIGRVGDRVYAGDVLAKQIRISTGAYPPMTYKQPFAMDVVYEDDYFAIVNKPAGVVVYAHRGGGHGRMTIRAVLPFVLKPPSQGVLNSLRRPQPVHRLDKPTQGLLLVAKTKPAMVDLTNQFVTRRIRKTYTAIINGIPPEPIETSVSAKTAYEMGVDVDPDTDIRWQLIDEPLDGQSAVTVWRALRYSKCLKAEDQTLTLVELKPKTGRYHQLRRHMAWVCGRPLAGDKGYDGGGDAMALRSRGLFLCSNRVTLEHPFYNSVEGQERWRSFSADEIPGGGRLFESSDGKVMVNVEIDLPSKFENFLSHEEERCVKLGDEA
jgi:23S rRNA-/tRNA-specific pseudouridylate synthase